MNRLLKFDYQIGQDILDQSYDSEGYAPFVDPKTGTVVERWLIKHVRSGAGWEVAQKFSNLLDCECKPRFYIQEPGFTLPLHKDRGTMCSINFILDEKYDPITFEDGIEYYKTAVLNTQVLHAVVSPEYERRLFKLSIFDKTYEEVSEIIKNTYGEIL